MTQKDEYVSKYIKDIHKELSIDPIQVYKEYIQKVKYDFFILAYINVFSYLNV